MGDVNGPDVSFKSYSDLAFVKHDDQISGWVVRILLADRLAQKLGCDGTVTHTADIVITLADSTTGWNGNSSVSVHLFRWNEDTKADVLVTARSNTSITLGYVYSGATLGGQPSAYEITRDPALPDGYLARFLGDVNGDGLGDIGLITTGTSSSSVFILTGRSGMATVRHRPDLRHGLFNVEHNPVGPIPLGGRQPRRLLRLCSGESDH